MSQRETHYPKTTPTTPQPPFPPELALGNIMRLKRPYWGQHRRSHCDKPFACGIVVEQLHATGGVPVVSLHLYDEDGVLYMHQPSTSPSTLTCRRMN